jgi:hypothetical protein
MRRVPLRPIGYADIKGGGQVIVRDGLCYIGHIAPPEGTTILDVSNPSAPRLVAQLQVPLDTHSHKVRVHADLMLVNKEAVNGAVPSDYVGGLMIYDIARRRTPRRIAFYPTGGKGVHRFDFDGRYAYLSTEMQGYLGAIILVLDLADPARPEEVSRWWLPGQWTQGSERPLWRGKSNRVHHGLRFDNKLYVACCHGGLAVVDISDIRAPKTLVRHPVQGYSTHTVLPAPKADGDTRDFVIAVDEGWHDLPGGVTVIETTDPSAPMAVASHSLPMRKEPGVWASHQPHENVVHGLLFVAWFGYGLRVLDVSDPTRPVEVASFVRETSKHERVMSNDIFVDVATSRVYLIDRLRGLDILEFNA